MDYDLTNLYYRGKVNMVKNTLSWMSTSMGILATFNPGKAIGLGGLVFH